MRSVDTLVSSNTLLDKMSTHLNGLLRNQEPEVNKAVQLFDGMFTQASNAMETEADKQVLAILKRQVSSFIGITLGVKPFLEQHDQVDLDEEDDHKLSWASANEKESNDAWKDQKRYHESENSDIYAPERLEHERLRQQLEEEQYGEGKHHGESDENNSEEEGEDDDSESEYEEIVETVAVKSREIGGAGGFEVVRRKQKKKKKTTTITTNFSYGGHSSNNYDSNRASENNNYNNNNNYNRRPPPRHHVRVCEFRPKMLEHVSPGEIFCMPVFFPSEDSYSVSRTNNK